MAYSRSADYVVNGLGERECTPGRKAWTIVASPADQAVYPRVLWLDAAGDVTGIPIEAAADTAVTFSVPSAGWFEMGFRRITDCPAGTKGVV